MNLRGFRHRSLQLLDGEILRAGDGQDHFFAPREQLRGRGKLLGRLERHDDGAVAVGVDEVARTHDHAGYADRLAETLQVHMRMRRTDRAGERLKARRPLRDVADRAVGDDAKATERLVHVALHLAPERAVTDIGAVEILDYGKSGSRT